MIDSQISAMLEIPIATYLHSGEILLCQLAAMSITNFAWNKRSMTISLHRQQDQTQIRWLKNKAMPRKKRAFACLMNISNTGGHTKVAFPNGDASGKLDFGYKFLPALSP